MYELRFTSKFYKSLKKLSHNEQMQTFKKLKLLAENPLHPSLRSKKVRGTETFEMSVNMDIRVIWKYDNGIIIIVIEVGHHKDVLGI